MQRVESPIERVRPRVGIAARVAVLAPVVTAPDDDGPLRSIFLGLAVVATAACLVLAVGGTVGDRTTEQVAAGRGVGGHAGSASASAQPVTGYRIRPGDSLQRVAVLHAIPVDQLAGRNGIRPTDALPLDTVLAVPATTAAG